MEIYLNGVKQDVKDGSTVKELLERFDIREEAVVVELNRNIINRQSFPSLKLSHQDVLEVVQFVGGG